MNYKSKYSIGRILKTPTELKQAAIIRKHQKSLTKQVNVKVRRANKNRTKPKLDVEPYEVLKKMKYGDFLNSKYWKKVRSLVLKRDSFKCIICKSNENLNVHHDTYKNHFKELDNLKDLMTLCKTCHTEHHYAQS